ncbi:cAMP-dependent protein kinase inhibitor gamma [Pimephales promelas]|nr:cAMP-dependent protein kinase inhibitor gamma [Pimephales promelas]KAG1961550.1 cAMP-dependent protein kinase inhibitor gamma [Pimephales promelas]
MMDVEASYSEFINCDRTGRRNAVPDIKGETVVVGTSELTKDMAQMDLKAAGTSHTEHFSSSFKTAPVLTFLLFLKGILHFFWKYAHFITPSELNS